LTTPLKTFQAIIFDMDGLLIDSEPLWRRAEMQVLNRLGVGLTNEMCKQTMGLRLDEMVDYWFDRFPWQGATADEVAIDILKAVTELVKTEGEALPGVDKLLRDLKNRQCKLAVASSSPYSLIQCVMTRLKLRDCFSVLCSAQDLELGKPHPGVYLEAARELEVDPKYCLALEDSPNGVKSALAAGMSVVAVPDKGSPPDFPPGVSQFDSLIDVQNWLTQ